MVEISLTGSGGGPGKVTTRGYPTTCVSDLRLGTQAFESSSLPRADFFVAGVLSEACDISNRCCSDTVQLPEERPSLGRSLIERGAELMLHRAELVCQSNGSKPTFYFHSVFVASRIEGSRPDHHTSDTNVPN